MTNLTRKPGFSQKKTVTALAYEVTHDMIDNADGNEIAGLPDNMLITHAIVHTKVAGQTGLTLDVGFSGGAELGNDLDVDNTGFTGGALSTPVDTGSGQTLTAHFSVAPTAGTFLILLQGIEYNLANGDLTAVV